MDPLEAILLHFALGDGVNVNAPILTVDLATQFNNSLTGQQPVDGGNAIGGTLVLVKAQTVLLQNGIYVASDGAWTLIPTPMQAGTLVYVTGGTLYARTLWRVAGDSTAWTLTQLGVSSVSSSATSASASSTNGGIEDDIQATGLYNEFDEGRYW